MKKMGMLFSAFALGLSSLVAFSTPALAATSLSINFESYVAGSINGQDGWTFTGPYDAEFSDNNALPFPAPASFGDRSLRMSNALTSGSFGDWVFSKSLTQEAGEPSAENGGLSSGIRQAYYEATFDLATVNPDHTPGLQVSVSPDRGDGARMSYLKFEDRIDGTHLIFGDYQDGAVETPGTCSTGQNFVLTDIATIARGEPHSIKLTMNFLSGQNNDVVKVYVDDVLEHTGTSWEGYFNFCENNETRTVDSLLFQARSSGGTAPASDGEGFIFDSLNLQSGPYPVSGQITNPANDDDVVSGLVSLTAVYDDGDDINDDNVQWAVRHETCTANAGTVFGNVDAHNDVASWNGKEFSYSLDTSLLTIGHRYCFVFNPTDDSGQQNIRVLRWFVIGEPVIGPPTSKDSCKKDGWMSFNNPEFKNQGDCVSFVASNGKAKGNPILSFFSSLFR